MARGALHSLVQVAHVAFRAAAMLVPTAVLALSSQRQVGDATMLWLGTAFQFCVCFLAFVSRGNWDQPIGPSIVTLYLIGVVWLWFGDTNGDAVSLLAQALLLGVPLAVFAMQTLADTGGPQLRKAHLLARKLRERSEWPDDLAACAGVPEVKALKAALAYDAGPALALLADPRPQVRCAALATLEFRKDWKPGQAELVLNVGQRADRAEIRAGAVRALGGVNERSLVEALANFLVDSKLEVRRAAIDAVLSDSERRWDWIRFVARRAVSDNHFADDGPFIAEGRILGLDAVHDLTAWCAEKGVLAVRSAETLAAHFHRVMAEANDPRHYQDLRARLASAGTPAILRLELARLLRMFKNFDAELLEQLLPPSNPAPLRLTACESILLDESKPDMVLRSRAIAVLKELARLPNREIALATADVVQRRLGVDFGLGIGQPLPSLQSRQAAEVSKRVAQWAKQFDDEENLEDSRPHRGAAYVP